jgi:hypothetical protein
MSVNAFHFISCLQPVEPQVMGDPQKTYHLTVDQRREYAHIIGARKSNYIPLTYEHPTSEEDLIEIKPKHHVGRLVEGFVRSGGQILGQGEIFFENRELIEQIRSDIKNKTRNWGVSLGVNFTKRRNPTDSDAPMTIHDKVITHVAITPTPDFGEAENGPTWMFLASDSVSGLYREFKKIVDKEPDMYMCEETRARLDKIFAQLEPESKPTAPLDTKPVPLCFYSFSFFRALDTTRP